MSPRLALRFLGIPQLILDNTPITTDRRKAIALLAYLGVTGGKYARQFLSGLLWPDYDQKKAFSNLRARFERFIKRLERIGCWRTASQ